MSSVNSAVYGVSWAHKKSGYWEPSEYPIVKQVVDAARRILARLAERKEPLSSVLVRKAISCFEKGNLGDLQLAALFSLAFYEKFLRIANHSKGSPLFRHVLNTKQGVRLRREAMSYSRAKELGKEGLDPTRFGIHTLCSAGASAAAALGVPDRLF